MKNMKKTEAEKRLAAIETEAKKLRELINSPDKTQYHKTNGGDQSLSTQNGSRSLVECVARLAAIAYARGRFIQVTGSEAKEGIIWSEAEKTWKQWKCAAEMTLGCNGHLMMNEKAELYRNALEKIAGNESAINAEHADGIAIAALYSLL